MRTHTSYSVFHPQFWKRGTGRELRGRPHHQTTFIYLFTNEACNVLGLYNATLSTIASDLGYEESLVREILQDLANEGAAHYDFSEELVYVPGVSRAQVGRTLKIGDKRLTQLIGLVSDHVAHPFAEAWWREYLVPYQLGPVMPNGKQVGQQSLFGEVAPPPASSLPVYIAPPIVQHESEPPPPVTETMPKKRTARGRKPHTFMRDDWQPSPEALARVPASLDAARIVEEFRNHWLSEGKSMADWDATFRNRISTIATTDWLAKRYVRVAPSPVVAPSAQRQPRQLLPPAQAVPPPQELLDQMAEEQGITTSLEALVGGRGKA